MPTRFLHECRRTAARNPPAPDVRRHATWPQSWMQRENWEFETHKGQLGRDLDENPRYVASGDRNAGGSLPGGRLHVDRTPLNYAPLSALCLLIRSSSSGSGNTMVELCSAPMSVSVCR